MKPLPTDGSALPFSLLAIALVGGTGQLCLGLGLSPPQWILPLGLALALAITRPWRSWSGGPGTWRASTWLLLLAIAGGALAITWGSVATTDRSWDGFATWSLTARHLLAGETLGSPYFADPTVFHYVRGYPLLQPVLLQQFGSWLGEAGSRVWFARAWLALLQGVAGAVRAGGGSSCTMRLAVAGLALTPMFLEPGGGSAESGFADLLVAAIAVFAAQATLANARWIALCAGLLLPLTKNEGMLHLTLWIATAAAIGHWRGASGFLLGGVASLMWWLPLQHDLLNPGGDPTFDPATLLPIAALLTAFAAGAAVARFGRRCLLLLLGIPLLAAFLLPGSALREQGALVTTLQPDWSALPDIAGNLIGQAFWFRGFGATFLLLGALAVYAWLRRQQDPNTWKQGRILVAYATVFVAAIAGFVLVVPTESRELFIREGISRYLGQILGVSWAAIGILLVGWSGPGEPDSDSRSPAA